MLKFSKTISWMLAFGLTISLALWSASAAQADEIDVSYLQTCLKDEGSTLDVLVLMDASASLRNARPGDPKEYPKIGSDPERKRGKILKSSLKLLQTLANESNRAMNINLRTFGKNSDPKELQNLEDHSIDWTSASKGDLGNFVEKALYDDSSRTEWASGLASAKNQFKKRIGEATLGGKKSCPIMFWITDGAPTDSTAPICESNTNSSIDWFRENNILVLGGLLQPRDEDQRRKAGQFRPIVTGENCGTLQPGWTRGEVIEANDIGDLAWGFVGLVASIKNLINLGGSNSSFFVDPGSSHIEIFFRGAQDSWSIKSPDGNVVCSSASRLTNRCEVSADAEIGIVTVTVFPENPSKTLGTWTISPSIENGKFKVYGSLNTTNQEAQKSQPRLKIIPLNGLEVEEGKNANFTAKIINPDGTDFSISGFKNVSICAKVASAETQTCKGGSGSAELAVTPVTTDKSVSFEAVLTSSYDEKRNYRIAASQNLNVIPSGIFPSLTCNGKDSCKFENLKNKKDKSENLIEVKPAKSGDSGGQISLVKFTILSDEIENRGDGHFFFEAEKTDGERLSWPNKDEYLKPGETIRLKISTNVAGDSEIKGVLKYKVLSGEKEIIRQLSFNFEVGHGTNWLVQLLLLIIAYLITLGIPYLFLLWSAKKSAVLNVPDNALAYLVLPFEISPDGKLFESGNESASLFAPDYKKLIVKEIEPNCRSLKIENISIDVIPPKWNPFTQVQIQATLPDNYIFSTYGKNELSFGKVPVSSSLLDEAIFFFPGAGNIGATRTTKQEITEDDTGLGYLNSSYESKLNEVVTAPSTNVTGSVLFLVSPYVNQEGKNKEQSLISLVQKIPAVVANLELPEKISELRAKSLKEVSDALAAEKSIKIPDEISGKIPEVQKIEDTSKDEWGGGSSTSSTKTELPDSKQSDDSW